MKKYKFLGFGLFVWFLAINSNALNNYIYSVNDSSKNIQICRIYEATGYIESCFSSNFGVKSPLSIAISKDSHYAYVSTTEHKIYICKIRNTDGALTKCVLGSDKINFESAISIAVTNSRDRFYVLNQASNSIWECIVNGKKIEGCNVAGPDFVDVDSIVNPTREESENIALHDISDTSFAKASSIAISPNDEYAYISFPKQHQIAICQINKGSRRFGDCHYFANQAFQGPYSIAIDPTGMFAYITDSGLKNNAVSCKLIEHGSKLGQCTSYDLVTSTSPKIVSLDPEGKNIYLSFTSNSSIMKCKITNGEYGLDCGIYTPPVVYPHKNYVYAVNKDGTVYVCNIQEEQGDIKDCISLSTNVPEPISIVISKDYQYAYISTKEDKVYNCKIDDENGNLKSCNFSGNSFQVPVAMALNHSGDKIYAVNQGNSSISVCLVQSKKLNDCTNIASFGGMKASSIAISPDDRHAYITFPEAGVIDVCEINSDGSRFTKCETRIVNDAFNKPHGIAIDPAGKYAYIVDNDNHASSKNQFGVSCKVIESGSQLAPCKRQSLLSHPLPNNVALDLSGKYAYFSFSSSPSIMRCEIHNGEYQHCRVHYDSNFTGLISLSYR